MDGKIDIFTLVFLVLAVVIVLRLRSVLGRKSSEDDARVERYKAEQRARSAAAQNQDKVVTLPRRDRQEPLPENRAGGAAAADIEEKVRTLASGNEPLADGLIAIARADQSFDPEHFLVGARQAYEMIVTSFADGNRKTLRGLLGKDVFDGFSTALSEREARGEQIDQSFVGINKADILEAELKGNMAHITVRFASELISATRDRIGSSLPPRRRADRSRLARWDAAAPCGTVPVSWVQRYRWSGIWGVTTSPARIRRAMRGTFAWPQQWRGWSGRPERKRAIREPSAAGRLNRDPRRPGRLKCRSALRQSMRRPPGASRTARADPRVRARRRSGRRPC